MEDVELTQNHW